MSDRHETDGSPDGATGQSTTDAAVDWREAVTVERLRYAAAGLAFVVAALHLFHPDLGFFRLIRIFATDPALLASEPRPLAFVLSAFAILAGVNAAVLGAPRRPLYVAGMIMMATYAIGYVAWHYYGHGGFLPAREPHYHDAAPLELVVSHLMDDTWAAASMTVELVLFALLAVLLLTDR